MESQPISKKLLTLNTFLLLGCLAMIFVIYDASHKPKGQEVAQKVDHSFDNVSILAKSAIVYDVYNEKIIYRKNEIAQVPLASLTKLMTALTAYELVPKNSKVTIRPEFLQEEGDTGLLFGEKWKLSDLIDFSLITSSNDGARSVASVIGATLSSTTDFSIGRKDFIEKMNTEAKKLGLNEMYFYNETGLDLSDRQSGGYGSAFDVARLLEYMIKNKPNILEATKYDKTVISSLNKAHTAKNTNSDINKIPGLLASKTGYTKLAGGNLVVAFDSSMGKPIIVVVLGSTQDGRFDDVMTLVNATMKYISRQ